MHKLLINKLNFEAKSVVSKNLLTSELLSIL